MTIVVTGGHLTPALAFIDEFRRRHPQIAIVFLGRSLPTQESRLILARGLTFLPLTAAKLSRHFSWTWPLMLVKFPFGFFQALAYLRHYRPRVVVSFGSYLALPVAVAAACLKIPLLTHEQGQQLGLANRLIGYLSQKVALSWSATVTPFPSAKVVVTGNPIRAAVLNRQVIPLADFPPLPLIYVTGGNQGSRIINQTLAPILSQLLRRTVIVHQTGPHDEPIYQSIRAQLPQELQSRYLPQAWFEDKQVSWCLHRANLVVSRAGANTVAELAFTGTPSLLIPLPYAQQNEQWHNAQVLAAAGTALILSQAELNPARLLASITRLLRQQRQFRAPADRTNRLVNKSASHHLVRLADELAHLSSPA